MGGIATGGCEMSKRAKTVGEHLDERIAAARQQVERLCIVKAKAEALNILDHPIEFYQQLSLQF